MNTSPEDDIAIPAEAVLTAEETVSQLRADFCRQYTDRIHQLEVELAAALADKERLDWLCQSWDSQQSGYQCLIKIIKNVNGSLRAAIDQSRKEQS